MRIISGTLVGGMLGFYLMHRAELKYKVCCCFDFNFVGLFFFFFFSGNGWCLFY